MKQVITERRFADVGTADEAETERIGRSFDVIRINDRRLAETLDHGGAEFGFTGAVFGGDAAGFAETEAVGAVELDFVVVEIGFVDDEQDVALRLAEHLRDALIEAGPSRLCKFWKCASQVFIVESHFVRRPSLRIVATQQVCHSKVKLCCDVVGI